MRLLQAGVYYRNREAAAAVGVPQMLLGLAVLILAGLVLGGGAIVLLGNSRPRATPTNVAVVPTATPLLTASGATPSAALTPTLPPTPTLIPTGTPPILPTFTPAPTPAPTPTPVPTPQPTPVNCAVASQGTNVKHFQMGLGHPTSKALPKVWCIRHVTIDQWTDFGEAKLLLNKKVVFQATCQPPGPCGPAGQDFAPPYQANPGKTLHYEFTCIGDPATIEDECADPAADGGVITIDYENFTAP